MPLKKRQRRTKARTQQTPPPAVDQQEQEVSQQTPDPVEEEHAAANNPANPPVEIPGTLNAPDTDLPPSNDDNLDTEDPEGDALRRRVAPRTITNFSEEQKDRIIDFLQQNPVLYSKRLAGYKDTAAKERLWAEQARQINCTSKELQTWYDSMRTKLGKLKKAMTKSGQAADGFTATEL